VVTWARFVIRFRVFILVIIAGITGLLGYAMRDLTIDPDVIGYFPSDDPAVELFNRIGDEYGGTSMAIIALETDEIFRRQTIADIAALTDSLKTVPGVVSVTSLADVIDIRSTSEGLEIARLINTDNLPADSVELAQLRTYALSKDLVRGRILSEDHTTTALIVRLSQGIDETGVARELRTMVDRQGYSYSFYFGGFPFQMLQISEVIIEDLRTLIPISVMVVMLCLLLGLRGLWGVLLPLLTVLGATVWTLGLMAFLKVPLTILSDVVPVILIAVGSAYGIHVVNRFLEMRSKTPESNDNPVHALSEIGVSVFLAGFTTLIGFLSFVFGSYLTLVRDFGIFTSIGIACALVLALSFVPAALSLNPVLKKIRSPHKSAPRSASPYWNRMAHFVLKNQSAIIFGGILVAVVAAMGIPRIEREAAILDYFKPGTGIRRAERILKEKFGGSIPLQIVVKGDVREPATLRAMERTADFLDSLPGVGNTQSVADLIKEMHEAIGKTYTIPESRAKIVNLWFLLDGESIMEQLVKSDYSEGVIQATVSDMTTKRVRRLVTTINTYVDSTRCPDCSLQQTGLHVIYRNLDESIVTTLYSSLSIAVVLVFLALLLLLRSFSRALIGLIPIVFTLVVIFGVMGWVGLPLDIVTVLIGSVSIGIGIDYSIHFIHRLRHELSGNVSSHEALARTLRTTGKAIIVNMVTVALGFLVLVFADLIPLQQFGILVAITMVGSGIGALSLLPAAMISPNDHPKRR